MYELSPLLFSDCPQSHPNPFLNGQFCCGTDQDSSGNPLTFESSTCKNSFQSGCPNTPCRNADKKCPLSHPNAYHNGEYCCRYNKDKEGNLITLGSIRCKNDAHLICTKAPCVSLSECPLGRPNPYQNGQMCCGAKKDSAGNPLTYESRTCTAHYHAECPNPPCGNAVTKCPLSHPYTYLDGEKCCQYNEDMQGNQITLESNSCRDDTFSICTYPPCVSLSECPLGRPYPYQNGQMCCGVEKDSAGNQLTYESRTCMTHYHTECPNPPCGNAVTKCPLSHPNAYYDREYCCRYNKDKDGNPITFGSFSCKNDSHLVCTQAPCVSLSECPLGRPYPYQNGQMCCGAEKDSGGNQLTYESRTCMTHYHTECPNPPCGNGVTKCPVSHPYAYVDGEKCCQYNTDMQGNQITLESNSCKEDTFSVCTYPPCVSLSECPQSRPFPFQNGQMCCGTEKDGAGNLLKYDSRQCESNYHTGCPNPPCGNALT